MGQSLPPALEIPLLPARTMTAPVAAADTWRYVDEARTHEVQVTVRRSPSTAFVIRERAIAAQDIRDLYEQSIPMEGIWESKLHHFALETRLTLLGNYHRLGVDNKWTPVRRNTTGRALKLDPLFLQEDRGAEFHYYGSRKHDVTALLIATRVRTAEGMRWHVTRAVFRFPDVTGGELVVVHPRLTDVLLRSVVAAHDLECQEQGLEKLVFIDRTARGNAEWWARLDACLVAAQKRIATAAWGGDAPKIPSPAAETSTRSAARPAYEYEDAEPAAAPKGATFRPAAKIEEVEISWAQALAHPRLLELHRRFLTHAEQAEAMAGGEIGIRKLMKAKRDAAAHGDQHFLSLLEASLLVRHALSPGGTKRVEPALGDLLRRSLAYL